jgi:type I restriction enzyme S subunit
VIFSRWPTFRVDTLIQKGWLVVNDGYRTKQSELGHEGVPFVRGGDIRDGWIETDVADHVTEAYQGKLQTKLSRPGDIAFIAKGTVGRVGRLRVDQPTVVFAPQVCSWRSISPDQLDGGYVFYLLRSRWFQSYLDSVKTSGAMVADYVSLSDQRHFELPIPPIAIQRRIAAVLDALDDKIELNRKMNRTLEEMAQALFKSWFIDFDGHEDFGIGELGPIPRGWKVRSVEELASRIAMGPFGSRLEKSAFTSAGVPIIKGGNLSDGFVDRDFDYVSEEKADELASSIAVPGDIVFTHRGTLGQVGRIPKRATYSRYVVSQSQMYLRPDDSLVDGLWFYRWFLMVGMRELLLYTSSTGVPAIGQPSTSLKKLRVIAPPRDHMETFARVVGPLDERFWANRRESETLAELRDLLLPRLISGELRIREAETIAP